MIMKKILVVFVMAVIAMSVKAEYAAKLYQYGNPAGCVRITPSDKGDTLDILVTILADRNYDEFHIAVESFSEGIEPIGFEAGPWLNDEVYLDKNGEPQIVETMWEADDCWCHSKTMSLGFEPDGSCYGTVKWRAGLRILAVLKVKINEDFSVGRIRLAGYLASGPDAREYEEVINGIIDYETDSYLYLEPEAGDVNADGEVNIADVTALIDTLL